MSILNPSHPLNLLPLRHLRERARDDRPVISAADHPDPYWHAGTHPEVVELMWDVLGKGMPPESRCVVHGHPALVHPVSGVILAVGYGTAFLVRLLEKDIPAALTAGCIRQPYAHTKDPWPDAEKEFGPDWVYGSFDKKLRGWVQAAYEHYGEPGGSSRSAKE